VLNQHVKDLPLLVEDTSEVHPLARNPEQRLVRMPLGRDDPASCWARRNTNDFWISFCAGSLAPAQAEIWFPPKLAAPVAAI
jgi:hypothetical protein